MADTPTPELADAVPETETDAEHVPSGAPEGDDDGPAEPEDGEDGQELDADALRAELKAVRAEAARYRTKARETAEALKAAKTPEEYQAVADRAAELETDLHRERLARRYNLPDALAARISGEDDTAREADAKALAEILHGQGGGMGRGGLDPSATPVSNDPGELAAGIPRARR
ncbi:hypothetical protein ADL21_18305 [Streptomyces albus subsp. albus]|nr:hypothetical protein ADL21_18305 [Streptomyces albus subsp. albus]